jgi:phosphopantothenoylcysteine decarboxylase/phosphopantothenate--cysteine ligase
VKVLITLGPTQEPIDSIRYVTTASSGKMGAALAAETIRRGHQATIISGPVNIILPRDAHVLPVRTAAEMTQTALKELEKGYDILIASAAVADYTPAKKISGKIKSGKSSLKIDLKPTQKLTHEARKKFPNLFIAAFKAEHSVPYEELVKSAENKLRKEDLDLIAANDIGLYKFGSDENEVTLISRKGIIARTKKESKEKTAKNIWDVIEKEKMG